MALGLVPATVNLDQVAIATNKVDLAQANLTKVMKKYGPESLEATKASLEFETATKNLDKSLAGQTGAMTAAAKSQAALSLITKDTKNAHGDFKNTADGLANSQRIAKAEMENLSAEMGKVMLPLMVEGTKLVKGLVEKFMSLSPEVRKTILVVVGVIAVLGPVIGLVGTLITIIPALGTVFMLLTGPIGLIILAVTLLALVWATNLGDIQGKTKVAVDFLLNVFDGFKLLLLNTWKGIVLGVAGAINGVIGVINGFHQAYNGVAEKLGLPLLGKIELVTPNLDAVNQQINQVARDRFSRVFATVYEQAAAGGGGLRPGASFATGGIVPGPIGAPMIAKVHGGEEVLTPEQRRRGGDIHIHFDAPVYGVDDFNALVRAAVRDGYAGGGFRGVR